MIPSRPTTSSRTIAEADRLDDDALLRDWNQVRVALDVGGRGRSPTETHRLRQRHFAFRKAAVERFGVEGHVVRYEAAAAAATRVA